MTNSLKFPHHNLNSSQYEEIVNEKKFKKKSKNSNKKNKGRKSKNAHSTAPSNIPMDCKEQNYCSATVCTSEIHPTENYVPLLNNYMPMCNEQPIIKVLDDQIQKNSTNNDSSSWEKKSSLVVEPTLIESNLIEINLPPNQNFLYRFHRVIKIDELGKIMIKIIYPDKPATYIDLGSKIDIINQCNTSDTSDTSEINEFVQIPSIIPDGIVIKLPAESEQLEMSISELSTLELSTLELSTSELSTSVISTSDIEISTTEKDAENPENINNSNCDYKHYMTQDWISNSRINSHEQLSFDRGPPSLENFISSNICQKERSRKPCDHVPSEIQSDISTSDCLLDATISDFEINSNIQSTTTTLLNEQLNNVQNVQDSDNNSIMKLKLPPHGCYHNNDNNVKSCINDPTLQLLDSEIVSSLELDLTPETPETLMVKLPAGPDKQLKCLSKSQIPNISPELKANEDHIADQCIDEISFKQENSNLYYLSERSMSPEHLSPVIEEDETLIPVQNSQMSDCSTLNEYDLKELNYSDDLHIESHAQDDIDFDQSCDESNDSNEIHYEESDHCPELDAIYEHLHTLDSDKDEFIRLSRQLQIIRNTPYPVDLPLSNSWTMYYVDVSSSKTNTRSTSKNKYSSTLHSVFNCSTVPELCEQYKTLTSYVKPSDLKSDSNLNFFKDDIQPLWEDERNEKLWDTIVMLLAGDMIDCGDNICGAICARRNRGDRVEIWIGSQVTDEEVEKIKLVYS
ncbi:605_t:CDS:2 [Gigaspora rosea]|nr:605_t:CDS:2 [Gigaspora rosea]